MTAQRIVETLLHGHGYSARQIIEAANHAERLQHTYPNVPPEILQSCLQSDPTNGSYANWIVDKVVSGTIKLPEDASKVQSLLAKFNRIKHSLRFTGSKNLYDYKTYGQLARACATESKGQETKQKAVRGAVQVAKRGSLTLVNLTTREASEAVCHGTEWCIKDPKWYDDYAKSGRLYVVLKDGAPYVAVHSKTQAMDVYDDPIDDQTAIAIAPLFKRIELSQSALHPGAEAHSVTRISDLLKRTERRYIEMLRYGYTDTESGRVVPPHSAAEARAVWNSRKQEFVRAVTGSGHTYGFVNVGLIRLARAMDALKSRGQRSLPVTRMEHRRIRSGLS